MIFASKSTSAHRRPRSSDERRPVNTAVMTSGRQRSATVFRIALTSGLFGKSRPARIFVRPRFGTLIDTGAAGFFAIFPFHCASLMMLLRLPSTFLAIAGESFCLGSSAKERPAERRPWVAVEITVAGISWEKDGVRVTGAFQLKNTGHSPVMHVLLQPALTSFLALDSTEHPFNKVEDLRTGMKTLRHVGLGFPLFPDETKPVT